MIEVENEGKQSRAVRELVDLHLDGKVDVALLAASASENDSSRRFPGNAGIFDERVAALGWDHLPIVLMPAVIGLCYFDFCFLTDDSEKFEADVNALWEAIAPNVPSNPLDHTHQSEELTDELIQSSQLSKWRNTWCDVISAYSHIHARRDVFVTLNTKDFQRNHLRLAELGMRCVATPEHAVRLAKADGSSWAGELEH